MLLTIASPRIQLIVYFACSRLDRTDFPDLDAPHTINFCCPIATIPSLNQPNISGAPLRQLAPEIGNTRRAIRCLILGLSLRAQHRSRFPVAPIILRLTRGSTGFFASVPVERHHGRRSSRVSSVGAANFRIPPRLGRSLRAHATAAPGAGAVVVVERSSASSTRWTAVPRATLADGQLAPTGRADDAVAPRPARFSSCDEAPLPSQTGKSPSATFRASPKCRTNLPAADLRSEHGSGRYRSARACRSGFAAALPRTGWPTFRTCGFGSGRSRR